MKQIYISDPSDEKIEDMISFCHSNSLSLIRYDVCDVSDVSGCYDTVVEFCFENEADAVMFKLKWK